MNTNGAERPYSCFFLNYGPNFMNIQQTKHRPLRPLSDWLKEMGVTSITGYRWRLRGWLKTTVIAGRQYLSDEAITEFQQRAAKGEFAAVPKKAN